MLNLQFNTLPLCYLADNTQLLRECSLKVRALACRVIDMGSIPFIPEFYFIFYKYMKESVLRTSVILPILKNELIDYPTPVNMSYM